MSTNSYDHDGGDLLPWDFVQQFSPGWGTEGSLEGPAATPQSRRLLTLAHPGSRATNWGFDFTYSAAERSRNQSISFLMQSVSFTGGNDPGNPAGQGGREESVGEGPAGSQGSSVYPRLCCGAQCPSWSWGGQRLRPLTGLN